MAPPPLPTPRGTLRAGGRPAAAGVRDRVATALPAAVTVRLKLRVPATCREYFCTGLGGAGAAEGQQAACSGRGTPLFRPLVSIALGPRNAGLQGLVPGAAGTELHDLLHSTRDAAVREPLWQGLRQPHGAGGLLRGGLQAGRQWRGPGGGGGPVGHFVGSGLSGGTGRVRVGASGI